MTARATKVGRNDLCSCGSGKKYKNCCAAKENRISLTQRVVIGVIAAALVGGLIFSFASREEPTGPATGVWSQEHGHYH